ncbi:glucose-1-phosphate adenylyltransferase [Paenibacillus sp. IB182496]|uniref:Glucose-1-phosphate adenylyltransferase n=1 Tax=Paenibacillus sabuli TaxID=2772509 RepID=A0A927BQ53_9BACL|nr:glucose-1-phosphate adenylyltransferase [Paenibacillus sabuli]MBD2843710.1 glucose-1-phosphate adenylyltransferase [Paenibacillus sabuli]
MRSTTCVAMILAGGEGRRLNPLTSRLAKPAVPFGGNYRIIDFSLSNCRNSGLDRIGVLTQYMADSLHRHIGDGAPWLKDGQGELDLLEGCSDAGTDGYCGTADAIYRNLDYLERHNPEHVLILSGDHIYQMDYRAMLDKHLETDADVSVAVHRVPWEEASRFGVLTADESMRVTGFAEKPARPQSNLASMGVYVFRWRFLREQLLADAANTTSSHDFGKDILPGLIGTSSQILAYPFEGYWRDVGTVDSLWDAHMDLLRGRLELERADWPLYTRDAFPAQSAYCHPHSEVHESLVQQGCAIEGNLYRSILSCGVRVGQRSRVEESIVMPNVRIGRDAVITNAIVGEGAIIEDGAVVGSDIGEITVVAPDEFVFARGSSVLEVPGRLLRGMYKAGVTTRTGA